MWQQTGNTIFFSHIKIGVIALSAVLLSACGGGSSADPSKDTALSEVPTNNPSLPEYPQIIATDQVRAYRPTGPYAAVLKTCALVDYRTPCKES